MLRASPLKSGARQGYILLFYRTTPIVQEVLARALGKERTIRGISIRKKEVKLSLFAENTILYIDNPKDSTKKLLELIKEFSKLAGHKMNIGKSVLFLCIKNKLSEKEIKQYHLQ